MNDERVVEDYNCHKVSSQHLWAASTVQSAEASLHCVLIARSELHCADNRKCCWILHWTDVRPTAYRWCRRDLLTNWLNVFIMTSDKSQSRHFASRVECRKVSKALLKSIDITMTNGLDCRRAVMVWCSDMTVTWWQCLETSITDTVTSWVSQLCHYSHVPEYVYLMLRYLLTECVDDDQYNAVENDGQKCLSNIYNILDVNYIHGPAVVTSNIAMQLPADLVRCVRCLTWPQQAADWSTRHRNYGGPDSAIVDRLISKGCDVAGAVHRQCRQQE